MEVDAPYRMQFTDIALLANGSSICRSGRKRHQKHRQRLSFTVLGIQ